MDSLGSLYLSLFHLDFSFLISFSLESERRRTSGSQPQKHVLIVGHCSRWATSASSYGHLTLEGGDGASTSLKRTAKKTSATLKRPMFISLTLENQIRFCFCRFRKFNFVTYLKRKIFLLVLPIIILPSYSPSSFPSFLLASF